MRCLQMVITNARQQLISLQAKLSLRGIESTTIRSLRRHVSKGDFESGPIDGIGAMDMRRAQGLVFQFC